MTALLRYQAALLIGSHRWLPPVILYAAWLAIGVQGGSPILDSFGYAAGGLLPVAVWLTRICFTNEPPAARNCAAAAAGPDRAHLAAVLTAAGAALVLAVVGVGLVVLLGDPRFHDHRVVPVLPAAVAGLLTALTCLLMGIAIGALSNWPVVRSPAWGIPASLTATLLLLVLGASPANAALSGMITGSAHGTVLAPWLPLAATVVIAAAAVAAACALTSRRS
ncbi:ABC transporter [Streptomyces sioyaensis]|uniref:ABC transporter n=1 Tax=Streptomyces sioyaensis TaxID=67364 RepID=UPI001F37BE97|nr:ABC transporter [Streptomyces sioyaensis]MCF3176771.1 ABC transporter [Streptomyces sioyaensis]